MVVAIVILSIAVFVLVCMYMYEQSKVKDEKNRTEQVFDEVNKRICKEQWLNAIEFYDELKNLVELTGINPDTILPEWPQEYQEYYNKVKRSNGNNYFSLPVNFHGEGISEAIKLSRKVIIARENLIKITREKGVLLNIVKQKDDNLKVIPYMAKIMADYETYPLEEVARKLDWGSNVQREKKVASIRDIRKAAKEMVEKHMNSEYQLAYLLKLFPNLEDIIDAEFNTLPPIDIEQVAEYDRARDYMSKEEYSQLSTTEKNQLALDRYRQSHTKTKWQIGRDYELYIGYIYTKKGYDVEYFGEFMGLEDLGRDLICKKDDEILIIQCKYWAKEKTIHEKHITQLYGTTISYCIEHNFSPKKVKGVLVTNIEISQMARRMADYLGIDYKENVPLNDYPCIKCNIGVDEYGLETKIYHLPFDQQYDNTKIDKPGEFFAMTVKEAEEAGFRRAFKWFASRE